MSIEESCLAELEKSLANNLFIKGAHPSHEDATNFAKFVEAKCVPDQDKYPSVWAWYSLMVLFEDEVIKSWKPAEKPQEKKGGKGKDQGKKGKKEKEGEKKDEGKKEEDDLDLFGEENEDDIKAKEEMKKKNKDKKKDKKKPVDKSHVILEIKGWEEGQDLFLSIFWHCK